MKFNVTFKTPEALHEAIINETKFVSEEKKNDVVSLMTEEASRWIEYGEYLTVQIDTDKKTCTVLENKNA
jgi:putative exporter of polyketide antibiotics